ncbi:Superfamily I DNA/RNA helicase [Methanonatronarchaeum thermophilum]|uniref:DNA helicase n=1 Tax=Methanonatronarchaeum thermophilum TaxID=1927129 RepID=A0A1Y3GDG3_9EURY|nr:IGHMBP2 family helicase [Methanonatronarchaeum thermophilum]OUJ19290.1 Superfamily I DNA/RNA helicase [Methanonatronarchaeum thermophilum]
MFQNYSSYKKHFSKLVELERKEEMERHRSEIKELSPREREDKGRALLNMNKRDEGRGVGQKYKIKFVKNRGRELPDNEISVGDLVMISKNEPLNPENPTGTVIEQTNHSITTEFTSKPPRFVFSKEVRIDLYLNDITYQRMLEALKKLENPTDKQKRIQEKLLGQKKPERNNKPKIEIYNDKLNEPQIEAVRKSLAASDIFLIHGPPGTGKTTTLVEAIEQHVDRGDSVLATADSNVAVDNLVEMLYKRGREVVRIGHPARVTNRLKQHTLDNLIQKTKEYQMAEKTRKKAFKLLEKQDRHTYPSGRWRRGLNNKAIKDLADKDETSRGIPLDKIKSMAKWLELQSQIDQLFNKSDRLEEKAINKVLDEAEVVCTTNSTAGSDLMENQKFDSLFIDEATQSTEPSCLIPITKTDKVVMAGDHKQLPPTILNEKAKQKGLKKTLFERMINNVGNHHKTLLTIQYRMNQKIMSYPNREFYKNKLKAAPQVKRHSLKDITNKTDSLIEPRQPITFIDTEGSSERQPEGSNSRQNKGEARITRKTIERLIDMDIEPSEIGVITPYDAQVDQLRQELPDIKGLEIKTVDGFQGREKEVIVVSLVRSNPEQEIGFLRDLRRLNVAITRAKRKLILIGDSETLRTDKAYRNLINYVQSQGHYLKMNPETIKTK